MKRQWFSNDDIPMNILSRLSTKTLNLLKLVSKDWLNLISDRSFITLHLKKSEPLSGFFFQEVFEYTDDEDVESITYIPISPQSEKLNVHRSLFDFLPDNVVIMSLNNGLICCRTSFPNLNPNIYVCNPLNKQWRSLMWPNHLPKSCSIALAFDPSRDPIDLSTDFNLVAVSRIEVGNRGILDDEDEDEEEEEYSFVFDVYSSKTRSWRRSRECCKSDYEVTKNRGVLADGGLYWLADEGYGVLMFDHRNELSCLIPGPIPSMGFTCAPEMCIGESGGKLHYVVISEHGLQLWILEDPFTPRWDLRFCASLEELEGENGVVLYNLEEKIRGRVSREGFPWMDPLCFKDGVVLLRVSAGVYLYEFETRAMRKMCHASDLGPKAMFSPIVAPYTMSLVPVEQA